jgi:FtsP/CotA-like multicopper oxidase with cupredoxin domain
MRTSFLLSVPCGKTLQRAFAVLAVAVLSWLQALPAQAASTDTSKPTGIACTTAGSSNPTFTLDAKAGYIQLADGTTAFVWSYANGGTPFQHPGPVLCVTAGDTVTVILNNTLPEPVSIMFPGQENVLADGVPAQPQFSAGALSSLTNAAAPAGGTVTYSFVAGNPGSYIYESGTMPHKQVRMGLFGALVVRPAGHPDRMNDRADSQYTTNTTFSAAGPQVNEEYLVLLSEMDPNLNFNTESNYAFDFNYYHPRYWLINGRGFPDSVADNFAAFLPEQPYGALARIHPKDPVKHPLPGAIRYLNVGTEEFPFHPHGNNGRVIGRDGRALQGAGGQDLSMEKFAINIGPSQAWDVIFDWHDAEGYNATNPVPVTIPQVNNQEFGMFYSGSPYLGVQGALPPGASTLNTCGEYYVISHNHALYQITSWGVNMTGPITYVRVDPPMPNNCQ